MEMESTAMQKAQHNPETDGYGRERSETKTEGNNGNWNYFR